MEMREHTSLRPYENVPAQGPPPLRERSHRGIVAGLVLVMVLLGATLAVSLRGMWDLQGSLRAQQEAVSAVEQELLAARSEIAAQQQALEDLDGRLRDLLGRPTPEAIAGDVRPSVFTIDAGERLGTGFVVESTGDLSLVLTNYHVVELGWEAGRRQVDLRQGRRSFSGTIVRVNAKRDLAVIEVDRSFPVLPLSTGRPKVGAFVLVFGSPEGYEGTVASGIVSALRQRWIQFSAPVSPGSSGGPVVNDQGEVIGVTVAKVVSESAEGISFAIRISVACRTVIEC